MTNDSKSRIKKVSLLILLLLFMLVIIMVTRHFSRPVILNGIRDEANETIRTFNPDFPLAGNQILFTGKGTAWGYVFHAVKNKKNEGYVFVMRMSGNSGPFTGVFLYTQKNGTIFCGLAGLGETTALPSDYGITERVLSSWISRINKFANDMIANERLVSERLANTQKDKK